MMTSWNTLTPTERNELIGDRLGFKPATQCWLGYQGRKVLITACTEETRAKAEELLEYMQRPENHEFCLAKYPSLRPEMFGKLEVLVERWHIRYSDTPGGGWEVVEWLNKRGKVTIVSIENSWRVTFEGQAPAAEYASWHAPTMAEAACLVALRVVSSSS